MKLTKSEEADMERIKVLEEMLDTSCKQIARLKKENQYLRAMLSGGATKVIGKLGFALGAACLSNTLSEIDIRKDERNKALSELREIEKGCAGHVDYEHKLALRVREFLKKNGMGD